MILRTYQETAVAELEQKAIKLLMLPPQSKPWKMVFKAPTGAGKTVIMASWLQHMAKSLPAQYQIPNRKVAYIWIAPNQLHQQSLLSLRAFFEATRALRCMEWQDLTQMELRPNEILFFNWQSISRDDAIINRDNETGNNLEALLQGTRKAKVEIIVILDEAHLFATKGTKAKELLERISAKIEIDVSATPITQNVPAPDEQVTVHRSEVIKAEMIKEKVQLNPAISDKGDGTALNEYLLGVAYKKLKHLEKCYMAQGSKVKPLLLIQLPSDNKALSADDRKIREMVEQWFSIKNVTTQNGKLAVWLSEDKINLNNIEDFQSPVEVLLFKQAIALGWDCPRAAVLVIFRDIKSETFTIQTVGRILRMPEQKHYFDSELNQGYVYTNLSKKMIQVVADDADYLVDQKGVRIKNYQSLSIQSSHINKRVVRNRLGSGFYKIFDQIFMQVGQKFSANPPRDWVLLSSEQDLNYVEINRNTLIFWEWQTNNVSVEIPKDVFITDEVRTFRGSDTKYAKTPRELDAWLHRYCLSAVGDFAPVDSAPVLKMALILLFEKFFAMDEWSVAKFVYKNQTRVQAIIDEAIAAYKEHQAIVAKQTSKLPQKYPWDVPLTRLYPEGHYTPQSSTRHVLQKFFENNKASQPEIRFVAYLNQHHQHLRWWYKNGDSGKEHFAVPYLNEHQEWHLFYVDFIIQLSDGTVAFFDTKSIGSDSEMAHKHDALQDYLQDLRQKFPERKFIGGVLIEDTRHESSSWKYPVHKLQENPTNTEGWETFDPTRQPYFADFDESTYEVEELT